MPEVLSLLSASPLVDPARQLFTDYGDFLRTIASTHAFNFERYAEEVATLPTHYTEACGELLLALADTLPAGCIAYRHAGDQPATTCEIKRLYIKPAHRRQGIAYTLIAEALRRAQARGYTRAILDTDIISMPAAYATYVSLGFTEYDPPGVHATSLRFLERQLL